MPAANAAALLRRNAQVFAERPAIRFGGDVWTHGDYFAESCRWANLFLAHRRPDAPFHVALLCDNTPEYLFALGGAGLAGATVVGLNHTRRDEHLLRDIEHTHCGLVIVEPHHQDLLRTIAGSLPPVLVTSRFAAPDDPPHEMGEALEDALAAAGSDDPGLEPELSTMWALIFTSGTSAAPKAVITTQRRVMGTGTRMSMMMELGPDDVGYIAMPLFHSNSVMVGWAPSIVQGGSVALARRFTASGWLPDVRRYGVTNFNYTGKPLSYILATPEQPDDGDNPCRVAYGNEGSPQVVEEFSRRFGIRVIDAFGATEGGVSVQKVPGQPPGAMGAAPANLRIVDEVGNELPRAEIDDHGQLVNADRCVGEIVNVAGVGAFEGYYNNDEANERTTRNGWYWSGDLGYIDADGFLFFAGRNADWIRVDGENFPAGPIEDAVVRHDDVQFAAVYGVPDEQAGDQVMVALVLQEGAGFDPEEFGAWIDGLPDVGPKWRPRYVRVTPTMPTTPTNKILKRTLVHEKFRGDRTSGDPVFVRGRGETAYRRFDADDERVLHERFVAAGRERFWEL